ncbi:protein of unknown function [Streptomyces murinus]
MISYRSAISLTRKSGGVMAAWTT